MWHVLENWNINLEKSFARNLSLGYEGKNFQSIKSHRVYLNDFYKYYVVSLVEYNFDLARITLSYCFTFALCNSELHSEGYETLYSLMNNLSPTVGIRTVSIIHLLPTKKHLNVSWKKDRDWKFWRNRKELCRCSWIVKIGGKCPLCKHIYRYPLKIPNIREPIYSYFSYI